MESKGDQRASEGKRDVEDDSRSGATHESQARVAREQLPVVNSGNSSGGDTPNKNTNDSQRRGSKHLKREQQDLLMPTTNISRIMRRVLPTHAKIADGTKETIQTCLFDFISRVTAVANECCHAEQRKTVTTDDLLSALGKLGMDEYVEFLTLYLKRYHSLEGDQLQRPTGTSRHDLLFQSSRGAGPSPNLWANIYPTPAPTAAGLALAAAPGFATAAPSFATAPRWFREDVTGGTHTADGRVVATEMPVMGYSRDNAASMQMNLPPPQPPFGYDPFPRCN